MVNDRKPKLDFNGKSDKSSSAMNRHSLPHQASTSRGTTSSSDRQRTSGSLENLIAREAEKRASSSRSSGTSGQPRDHRPSSLSTSMQHRTGTINLKEERERQAAGSHSRHVVKAEPHQSNSHAESSRLSAQLTSRRRQDDHGSDADEDRKPFGKRDAETLTVLEDLETGPIEYGRDPEGMAEWTWVEPNSGFNLR
jgi:minichromosome maintenance protein 10